MIILDISRPIQPKPIFFKGPFKHKTNYRICWLWFAVTFCNMSDYEYFRHVASGKTEWITE